MIFSNGRKILILSFVLLFIQYGFSQNNIEKNQHVVYKVEMYEKNYEVHYTFMDPFGALQTYNLAIPAASTLQMINKFGVPRWLFEPYEDTEYNKKIRVLELEKGLFKLSGNTIVVDKSAVIDFYASAFCKPIAEMIVSSLNDYGFDNRKNRIEFAMRFVQDIPYGIPQYEDKKRHYGGVNIIPKLLISGYGDCDSKVLLFAGIMTYLIPSEDFVFLNQPKHVLSAIKGYPETGQIFIRYKENKYLLAETSGPGKRRLGEEGKYYRNTFIPESLNILPTKVIPYGISSNMAGYKKPIPTVDENSIKINNESERLFKFQVSYDKLSWESMSLQANQSGNIKFDDIGKKYLRFRLKNADYQILELFTGMDYTFVWQNRKKRWQIM